ENEWLVQYVKRKHPEVRCQYYIFRHRHLPMIIHLSDNAQYINLGDWISYFTFGKFYQTNFSLFSFSEEGFVHRFRPISNRDDYNDTIIQQLNPLQSQSVFFITLR